MAIIACPKCGAKNRLNDSRVGVQPVCGRCGVKLSFSLKPLELTDATFDSAVNSTGDIPMLVDCWAPWCGPCRMLGPIIDQLAAEAGGRFAVAKLNTEINQQVAARFRIDAIPAMLIFRNGKLIDRLIGVQSKAAIEQRLLLV